MTSQPYLLLVNPTAPFSTVKDLIAYAKAKPGAISYGTAGIGSTTHIGTELLKSIVGIDIVNVPYKGNAQALVDLMAGRIQMMFASGVAAGPQVKSGKVKALALAGLAILSGILREERGDMLAALAASGWRVEREDHEDIWWSVAIARA